jgi:predicted ATPase
MPVYLNGLSLQFFKGIGAERQKLAPFKEFNFFIGANNAGKSTVLEFIHRHLLASDGNKRAPLAPLEKYTGTVSGELSFGVAVPVDDFVLAGLKSARNENSQARIEREVKKIAELFNEDGFVWLKYTRPDASAFQPLSKFDYKTLRPAMQDDAWQHTWHHLRNVSGGSLEGWIQQTINHLFAAQSVQIPRIQLIPAIRKIGPRQEDFSDFSGKGLIDRLAQIQSPDHDKRHERSIFEKINQFIQTVTDRPSAEIEVPHNREHILVHMDNKVLPLSSFGTGIHEVVMIAAFCTISENQIVCIEEPELHLHPLLQRKLISFLKDKTSNQYFIATHSASFIDTPDAAIFHVRNDGSQTYIRESTLRRERVEICNDLGVRASDLVQSNAAIWVEGPSDRIYVRHWINMVAPELVEGIDYSIMFYGGRLLSHLSADDEEITEFIALRSLNQNLALIMDSDRSSNRAEINETKKRLQTEFQKGSGIAWVTKGREIENYIDHALLQSAVRQTHPSTYKSPANSGGAHSHALHFKLVRPRRRKGSQSDLETKVDKVKVAKVVCEAPADLEKLDLRDRVIEIVEMIRKANI